jgi:hypothetical protein
MMSHSTECGWCRREVISFLAPPAMVEVTVDLDQIDQRRSFDRICLYCYTELVKLQARLAEEARQ